MLAAEFITNLMSAYSLSPSTRPIGLKFPIHPLSLDFPPTLVDFVFQVTNKGLQHRSNFECPPADDRVSLDASHSRHILHVRYKRRTTWHRQKELPLVYHVLVSLEGRQSSSKHAQAGRLLLQPLALMESETSEGEERRRGCGRPSRSGKRHTTYRFKISVTLFKHECNQRQGDDSVTENTT